MKFSSLISKVCMAVLSMLGYSCSLNSEQPDMYGTPTGSFEAKGFVSDDAGKPVVDADIIITEKYISSSEYHLSKAMTNTEGHYEAEGTCWSDSVKVVCIPNEVGLAPDSVCVKLHYKHDATHDKKHEKDWWYIGNASFTADFKLKRTER